MRGAGFCTKHGDGDGGWQVAQKMIIVVAMEERVNVR